MAPRRAMDSNGLRSWSLLGVSPVVHFGRVTMSSEPELDSKL